MKVSIRLQRDDFNWNSLSFLRETHCGYLRMCRVEPVGIYAVQKPGYKPWFYLAPEVEHWLDERNMGYELVFRRTRNGVKGHWRIKLERDHAMLFKLTWGGK